jgi:hypothetical protein
MHSSRAVSSRQLSLFQDAGTGRAASSGLVGLEVYGMALLLVTCQRRSRVELGSPGDLGDAGLSGFAGGKSSAFLAFRACPVQAVARGDRWSTGCLRPCRSWWRPMTVSQPHRSGWQHARPGAGMLLGVEQVRDQAAYLRGLPVQPSAAVRTAYLVTRRAAIGSSFPRGDLSSAWYVPSVEPSPTAARSSPMPATGRAPRRRGWRGPGTRTEVPAREREHPRAEAAQQV